jgi:BMFP domain-containing protein YqiC
MPDRPRFFDDLAGVAGGALSALAGLREEMEAMIRARLDETVRRLELVRREELDAVQEMAANARAGQEAAEARVAALEARVAELERARAATAPESPPDSRHAAPPLTDTPPGDVA